MHNPEDIRFMRIAISAAKNGVGKTFPRPSVGAVLVKNYKILSIAHTSPQGKVHAEPQAIKEAGDEAKGATLYVTLEPCNHHGNTPPCTDAVIEAGIKRVVIANRDINPKAAGGIEKLRAAGIEVIEGICANEALEVNKAFFSTIEKKRPYIIAKIGSSLDGKIALANGESKYITSEISRNYSQMLRSKSDAILVGVNTIINDNPLLTCRLAGIEKPLPKIILDTNNRVPEDARIIKNAVNDPVIIFSKEARNITNVEVIKSNLVNDKIDLIFAMKTLAERNFERLMIEGGGQIISSFISANLLDEIHLVYSPKILGGSAISFASGLDFSVIPENQFMLTSQRKLGDDILIVFKNKN